MGFNKISGLGVLPNPTLPLALPAGGTFMLPGGQGVLGSFGALTSPQIGSGNTLTGQYLVQLGQYTTLQVFDPGLQYWRNVSVTPQQLLTVSGDSANFRLINSTGCPVGGLITNAGSGGTNGFYGYNASGGAIAATGGGSILPGAAMNIASGSINAGNAIFTITPSAGGSLWNAIVGGGVNTTISLSGTAYANTSTFSPTSGSFTASGGSGYVFPPIIVFTPPPGQGNQPYILPEATCTISAGAINAVTVTNQGAGLVGLPGITVVPALGDTVGGGALLGWSSSNYAMVGSGTLMAMWPVFPGTAQTSVPTFTFGGTSNPAPSVTAIMNFVVTGFTQTQAGVTYTAAGAAFAGGVVSGSAANTNPAYDKGIGVPIFPPITVAATTGLPALAGGFKGVNIQAVPTIQSFSSGAAPGTAAQTTVTVGGSADTVMLASL